MFTLCISAEGCQLIVEGEIFIGFSPSDRIGESEIARPGVTVPIFCHDRSKTVSGPDHVTCQANGTWSDWPQTCESNNNNINKYQGVKNFTLVAYVKISTSILYIYTSPLDLIYYFPNNLK